MGRVKTRIRYKGEITAYMRRGDWNRQVDEPTWPAPMLLWKREFLPIHFTRRAKHLYDYAPRKGENLPRSSKEFWRSYFGRKLRVKRHSRPLVWSGETEQEAKAGAVKAFSSKVKYEMRVRKAGLRIPNSRVDIARELTALAPRERRAMVKAKERALVRRLREVKSVIQKTVG